MDAMGEDASAVELDRYELGAKLGAGGMAAVFRARDKVTGQDVALKLIENPDDDELRRARFEREVRAAGGLVHPGICRVLSFGKAPGKLFMAMELVEGITLHRLITKRATLPLAVALEVLHQLLGALDCAGRAGIVHRDLKPANIMITPDGTVKLLDFGIAKSQEDATVTATGFLVGTPVYMSPEQVSGKRVDPRSDLFSSGITLLVMLTGRLRFMGMEPGAILARITTEPVPSLLEEVPTAPTDADAFLSVLCANDADKRFQTAAAAVAAIERLADLPPGDKAKAMLRRYLVDPDAVAAQLASDSAARELARADALMKRGPAAAAAAAIALHRASLLDPAPETRRRLSVLCKEHQFALDFLAEDPAIQEATAAFDKTPHAPGVLKRLADLHRERGHLMQAASFLQRYLRVKPTDSQAAHQLKLLLHGPDDAPDTGAKLSTRDILAGVKTGGQMAPVRPADVHAPRSLEAQMPAGPALELARAVAPMPSGPAASNTMTIARPMRTGPPVDTSAPSGMRPLVLAVVAVMVAGGGVKLFSKFVSTTAEGVQEVMSEKEESLKRHETSAVARYQSGHLTAARAQFAAGSGPGAEREATQLLNSDPPGEEALEGLWIRARSLIKMDQRRRARDDLEKYLAQCTPADPRKPDVEKLLEQVKADIARD